jgi:SAM-dependent methyltransferase
LELGCGTGKHGQLLAQLGYRVTGIELSDTMLAEAQSRQISSTEKKGSFQAHPGDVRHSRFDQKFDYAISLFHVLSYQTSNADALSTLQTASLHISTGDIFLFDVWFSPAVLSCVPQLRVKKFEDEKTLITRIATPDSNHITNTVSVNYEVIVFDKATRTSETVCEQHLMRHFSIPEIELLCETANLKILHYEEWMTGRKPSSDTWGVVFVAVKQ